MQNLELVYALLMFGGFMGLMKGMQWIQRSKTGFDPEVIGRSEDSLQKYFARFLTFMKLFAVGLIVLHGFGPRDLWGFRSLPALDEVMMDHLGLAIGLTGLGVFLWAQWTMGASWRVGIDTERPSALVTGGVFGWIRNPTYLGQLLVNGGLWVVWPTPAMLLFVVMFYFFVEVQVRCEEQHLTEAHGEEYAAYCRRTTRYLPWLY